MPKVGMQPIRRLQLIEATLDAVNDVGMHEASISQIARRAGVSNGIISHYFRDKNGLLEATMRYLLLNLWRGVKERLASVKDNAPEARLYAIAAANRRQHILGNGFGNREEHQVNPDPRSKQH